MMIIIAMTGVLISGIFWLGLDKITIELEYRNDLLEEQNKILKDRSK
jgi:hypothetical protein|tara:strand:- start:895 stop:1035 length:141 start_codon:yes stop_codon:yes gene_type:complete